MYTVVRLFAIVCNADINILCTVLEIDILINWQPFNIYIMYTWCYVGLWEIRCNKGCYKLN